LNVVDRWSEEEVTVLENEVREITFRKNNFLLEIEADWTGYKRMAGEKFGIRS
jgi:hypothetical protein